MTFSLSDADLAAIGGASTFVLAAVAVAQMRHSGRQIEALRGQVVREAQDGRCLSALLIRVEPSAAGNSSASSTLTQ